MRFNPRADISAGRVRDVRGGGGGGGLGGLPIGAISGGGIGTTILVIIIFVIVQLAGGGSGAGSAGPEQTTDRYDRCLTGADANQSQDCARKAVEESLESYWSAELPAQTGRQFSPTQIVTFTGATSTGCGDATKDVGPFYCPTDQTIYLDTTFFQDVLQGQLNGPSGAFVEPYVIAHEFGHHIQNLLGTMSRVKTQEGPTSDSVRLELQADCYAGMWSRGATGTTDTKGVAIFESITQADVDNAISAAKAVGDDYIQRQGGGQVNKEAWTHGSSEQRQRWFTTGYNATSMQQCDTFSTNNL
ncbi:MAG TPA: neutral zinc metallopeptidase [Nocardioides sp.]|nr:neutral zinc metallopeptidase [Nocardioides sp.]